MAESIRYYSPNHCEPDYIVRERWVYRLTKIAILVAAVQAFVLAFSLIARVMDASESAPVQQYATPFIPPKPDFKVAH